MVVTQPVTLKAGTELFTLVMGPLEQGNLKTRPVN